MTKILLKSTILLTLIFSPYAANANTIDNLERERAKALNLILDKSVSIGDRKSKLEKSKMRLLDLERMTINSKNINKNPSYQTIKAFEEFDLTFLVHSSLEKGKSLSLTWLEKIGLTTENLMSTRVSRK
ncbi:hypothetical protein OAK51_04090 [Alphaproteobacteria bacterium]|nr:hypothetical protein [Alphaproteobacteria bacterium]